MSAPMEDKPPRGWPLWLKLVVAPLLAWHLFALFGMVLSTGSGPWIYGRAHGPVFAMRMYNTALPYLRAVRLQEDYRFESNRYREVANRVEVRLWDKSGKELATVRLPDPDAWPWTRHRQQLLAEVVSAYVTVEPRAGEVIPAPGQAPPLAQYWRATSPDGKTAKLETVEEHLLPRNEELTKPSNYALTAVRSLSRSLRRQYGAEAAEVVRVSRPFTGAVLLMPSERREPVPLSFFDETRWSFGVSGDLRSQK